MKIRECSAPPRRAFDMAGELRIGAARAAMVAAGVLGLFVSASRGQDNSPPVPKATTTPAAKPKPAPGQPAPRPVQLNLKNRRVIVHARVCQQEDPVHKGPLPLEFLVCRKGTKEHESILHTAAKPSDIHAALLALGLTQGKPARWSAAEGVARFLPPQGPELNITLRWADENGETHTAQAGSWLKAVGKKDTALPKKWVFVGSAILGDNRYAADLNGEIISVANFATSVIDVPFQSSAKNALLEYVADFEAIPPLGTEVKVIILPPARSVKSPHARATLEIDRFGRLRIDGAAVSAAKLRQWAAAFAAEHPRAMVVIRAEARTIVHDIERAREELSLAGIREIQEQRLTTSEPVLPRNRRGIRDDRKQRALDLGEADRLLKDPVDEARAVLRQIEKELGEMERLRVLWADYAAQLREVLTKPQAATRPADKQGT